MIKYLMNRKLFAIIALVCALQSAFAQRGWEIGGWLGTSYYFGDLNTSYYLGNPKLGGGLIGRFNYNNRVSLKLGANYGLVSAADADSRNPFERARNLSFQSQVFDGSMQLEINFLPYIHGSRSEFFTPYLFGGFSVFSYNPTAELNGERYNLRELGTEGQFRGDEYFSISGAFVYGGGLKFDLNRNWSINLEASARAAFTDYIDDVSTVFPDKKDLLRTRGEVAVALSDRSIPIEGVDNSQLGKRGTQRGNSKNRDNLVFLQIGLVRYFGNLNCPRP
jgi:opacity protein-like surface antigen